MRNRDLSAKALPRHWRLQPLALSLACVGMVPAWAQLSLPTGFPQSGAVVFGNVNVGPNGTATRQTLNQATMNAIVNWRAFSLAGGNTLNINQQMGSASVMLNRVVGTGGVIEQSVINGALSANGHVFVVNPSGILFGNGAQVNVGGLVASTLDISDSQIAKDVSVVGKGSQLLFGGGANDATSTARVMVQDGAVIQVGQGGTAGLIGALVRNEGQISVAQGSAGLVSASKVTLDFQGDGLTRFTVPADGLMHIDLGAVQTTTTGPDPLLDASTTAQVMNGPAAGSANARSGTIAADGGRVVLVGASDYGQLVVNQSGTVQARSLVNRGGEIVLEGIGSAFVSRAGVATSGTLDASAAEAGAAGGTVRVSGGNVQISGQLTARGLGSGAGGTVTTESVGAGLGGDRLVVDENTVVDASGGASGQNGLWEVKSRIDLAVTNNLATYTDISAVSDKAIGGALGRGTDVSVTSEAMRLNTEPVGWTRSGNGVSIDSGAQIVKNGDSRATTLAVNSGTNIGVSGSILSNQNGPLNVDLNADAFGGPLPDTATTGRAGTIVLSGATVQTDGGNIRLYGQSDAENGRAIGSLMVGGISSGLEVGPSPATQPVAAILLADSKLSTCAVSPGEACGGSGSITMRAQGDTSAGVATGATTLHVSHSGIDMVGGSMTTGAGAINLDGRGGIGASGLSLSPSALGGAPTLTSGSGTITLAGSSRSPAGANPTGAYYGYGQGAGQDPGLGAGTGVVLSGAAISTGGSVSIAGQGGDLSGLRNDLGLMGVLGGVTDSGGTVIGSHFAAGDGTAITGSSIQAGQGQTLSVTGTAGSQGFQVVNDANGTPVITPDTFDAWAVNVAGGRSLVAHGGQVSIGAGLGDVRLAATGYDQPLVDVSNDAGAGGTVHVTGRNILVAAQSDLPRAIDASGLTGGGSIDLHAVAQADVIRSGVAVVEGGAVLQANALGSGNGGRITVLGDNSIRAFGNFEARGGSAGGNGGTIETSGGSFDLSGIRVDASAPAGQAGRWIIDPYDVTIAHGTASGSLPTNPFEPVATSTIQDGDINSALNSGTSVTITTGSGGTDAGDIRFGSGMLIERTVGSAPLAFELDAAHSIGDRVFSSAYVAPIIRSTTGPMDVIFNAGSAGALEGYVHYFGNTGADQAVISTNGGRVLAHATGTGYAEVIFNSASIDTGGGELRLLTDGPSTTQFVALSGDVHTRGGGVTLDSGFTGSSPAFSDINIDLDGTIDTGGGAVSIHAHGVGGIYDSVTSRFNNRIITNGGAVSILNGQTGAPSGFVLLQGTQIDTRVGQSDAGAGGAVSIAGGGVSINGARIDSATGDVTITGTGGTGQSGSAVQLDSLFLRAVGVPVSTAISTTSGNVLIRGVQDFDRGSNASFATHGVLVTGGSSITTGSGNIALRGLFASAPVDGTDSGVRLEDGARLATTGGGSIELTGSSLRGTPGVSIQPGISSFTGGSGAVPQVQSSGNLVLRASNDGSAPALAIDAPVSAAGVINLRPGGMDGALNAYDATSTGITVGGAAGPGFTLSDALLSRLSAPTVVVGSSTHDGTITVAGPVATGGALTLQNEGVGGGAGGIVLNGAVTADRLGLLSAGDITQTVKAPITAQHLLARSSRGSVLLDQAANNVSENTLGGGAAGAFRYQDVDGVRIGALSVTGFDAGTNQPQVVSATSMAADTVFVRTLSGDLTLDTAVISTSGADLVAASRFQNAGGGSIGGAPWRIWADTWLGESRGGIAGSGATPNLYHCAYLGLCTVSITPGDNHFIYAQQPRATVVIGDASRPFGMANPPFGFTIGGLILGDGAAGFLGTPASSAGAFSPAGRYPITGSFTSAAGYAVDVVPGTLTVTANLRRPDFPSADLVRELPNTNTYTFDRNLGAPPICFATGPLEGDRAQQGGDLLAREWSRVRSRPNLLNCVDTEKRNGCADF